MCARGGREPNTACRQMVAYMQITPRRKKKGGKRSVVKRSVVCILATCEKRGPGHSGKQSCNDERHVTAHGDSISLRSSAAEMSCTAAGHRVRGLHSPRIAAVTHPSSHVDNKHTNGEPRRESSQHIASLIHTREGRPPAHGDMEGGREGSPGLRT